MKSTYIDVFECMNTEPPPQDYVFSGLLAGTVGVLVAPGGSGKSILCLQLASAVASALHAANTLGLDIVNHGPVLYVSLEDPRGEIWRRVRALASRFDPPTRKSVSAGLEVSARVGVLTDICDDVFFEKLLDAARGKRLVIIDTLSRVHQLDENDNGAMARVIARFEAIATATGAAILIAHHVSKAVGNGQGDTQQAARGASVLVSNTRFCGNLVPMTPEEASMLVDPSGVAIGDGCRYYVRYVAGKQNYGEVLGGQWYQRTEGGILEPVSLRVKGTKRTAAGGVGAWAKKKKSSSATAKEWK